MSACPQSGLRGPASVPEGGNVRIEVPEGVRSLQMSILGHGGRRLAVVGGVAEFRVPPGVAGGTRILVTDGRLPNPGTIEIVVVGSSP